MKTLINAVGEAWAFFRKKGLWQTMRSKEAPWLVQFGKYGVCGVMATVLHQLLFIVFANYVFPAISMEMPKWQRGWNWTYDNLLSFAIANTFVYFMNLTFVFEGGRHHPVKEFSFFTFVNLVAMVPALVLGFYAIVHGKSTPYAQVLFVIVAVMINFLARKFFVFKG